MILNQFNSKTPAAAIVGMSMFDDEPVIIPLTSDMQRVFNRRAVSNRKLISRGKK